MSDHKYESFLNGALSAVIAAGSSGNNTIVAAVSNKRIIVLSLHFICASAVTVKWQSGASGTDLTGSEAFAANGGIVLPHNPAGWFEAATSTLLNLSLSSSVSVAGSMRYILVS